VVVNPNDEPIFDAALEIADPVDRAAYLDRACAGDPALRAEVESLLAAYTAGAVLEAPAALPVPARDTTAYLPPAESAGTEVGPYTLREALGEGGMGQVFVAEQRHPVRRKAALKVIKPGMDSRQAVARFEAERQALALMDHPNIAKVLGAGTTAAGRSS
jgi:serine/threonine-protein kinase